MSENYLTESENFKQTNQEENLSITKALLRELKNKFISNCLKKNKTLMRRELHENSKI